MTQHMCVYVRGVCAWCVCVCVYMHVVCMYEVRGRGRRKEKERGKSRWEVLSTSIFLYSYRWNCKQRLFKLWSWFRECYWGRRKWKVSIIYLHCYNYAVFCSLCSCIAGKGLGTEYILQTITKRPEIHTVGKLLPRSHRPIYLYPYQVSPWISFVERPWI